MTNRIAQAVLLLIALSAWACTQSAETVEHTVQLDLSTCLGPIGDLHNQNEACGRETVNAVVYGGPEPNGCLVLQYGTETPIRTLVRWEEGRLGQVSSSPQAYLPNETLAANLLLYSEPITQESCDALMVNTPCTGACVVHLLDEVRARASGVTLIDFTPTVAETSSCRIEWNESGAEALRETCDGIDNNCNGQIDELEQCCTNNDDCRSERSDMFCDQAIHECTGCTQHSDCLNQFETRTFCDAGTGRCGECDTETTRVTRHLCGGDQPLCRVGDSGLTECDFCDPMAPIGENGCPYNRPCIDTGEPGDTPYCDQCFDSSVCPDDLECMTNGRPGDPFIGSCQQCNPVNSGTNERCMETGDSPYCSARGQCVPCTVASQEDACPEGTPYCLTAEDGAVVCGACSSDLDCLRYPGQGSFCDTGSGRCNTCRPGGRDGCSGTTPICDAMGFCRPCNAEDDCQTGICVLQGDLPDCASLEFVPGEEPEACEWLGRCKDCDEDGGECEATDRPICQGQSCVGCRDTQDCPADRPVCNRVGRCTQCPLREDQSLSASRENYTCLEDSATPFCGIEGECRGCNSDDECRERPGNLDVCIEGRCLGCRTDSADSGCTNPRYAVCDPTTNSCVQCVVDGDCSGGLVCEGNRCRGDCDRINQTGCGRVEPVCSENAECRACTKSDCSDPDGTLNRLIVSRCSSSSICRICTVDEPAEAVGLMVDNRPGERLEEAGYGCSLDSGQPICDAGVCRGCTRNEECDDRPGGSSVCKGDGRCVSCIADSGQGGRPDNGCSDERPKCFTPDNDESFCAECTRDRDCPGASVCVQGRCSACDPVTSNGCTDGRPICQEGILENSCEPCNSSADCRNKACGGDQATCPLLPVCNEGRCMECASSFICGDGRTCAGSTCVDCVTDDQCVFPEYSCLDGQCTPTTDCQPEVGCPNSLDCINNQCQLCEPDTFCSNGMRCWLPDQAVVPLCLGCAQSGCPAGWFCNPVSHVCQEQ